MSKHLIDHRSPPQGGRLQHFLRIARNKGEAMWRGVWQRPVPQPQSSRRVPEYLRIARRREE